MAAEPVHAAGVKGGATEACEDKLADKGYDGVDVDKARKRDGGDKVVVTGQAESGGDTDSVKCVYNTEKEKTRIK